METAGGGFPLGPVVGGLMLAAAAVVLVVWAIRTTARPK
jgi:hypothetical protein